MARRRIPRERERWLSAVLIVTAIVGVSAAIRIWPVAALPPVRRLLASRPLHAFEAPVNPMPGRVLVETPMPAATPSTPAPLELPEVVVADVSTAPLEVDVESGEVTDAPPDAITLLASGRLELPLDPPAMPSRFEPAAAAEAESHAILELPAVAVTRVVTVAGRGIRSGVRATTAVFKAAF